MRMEAKKPKKKDDKATVKVIAVNKRARFEYHIDERIEAGIVLQGWEIKSLRQGRIAFGESYALIRHNEFFLFGAQIAPLSSASTHVITENSRLRKLLMHRKEIDKLMGSIERKGYTIVPLSLYWKSNKVKVELGVAKGKQQHDKRDSEKNKDWQRDKARIMRDSRK